MWNVWETAGAYRVLVVRSEGKSPLGRCSVDGRIILKWVFNKWDGKERTGLIS